MGLKKNEKPFLLLIWHNIAPHTWLTSNVAQYTKMVAVDLEIRIKLPPHKENHRAVKRLKASMASKIIREVNEESIRVFI